MRKKVTPKKFITAFHWRAVMFFLFFLAGPPTLLAQWVNTGVDGIGFGIFANRLYAQGGSGGMEWTSDGITWNQIQAALPDDGVNAMTSIGNVMAIGFTFYGVFLSFDSGASWSPCQLDSVFGPVPQISAMTEHNGYLFAAENIANIYRSSDAGKHWDTVNTVQPSIPNFEFGAVCFASYDSLLIAGGSGSIFRTTNDGSNWQVVQVVPYQTGELFVTMTSIGQNLIVGGRYGAYRSRDLGLTWEQLDTNWFSGGLFGVIVVNGILVGGTRSTMLLSRDSGTTWEVFNQGLPLGFSQYPGTIIQYTGSIFSQDENSSLYHRPVSDLSQSGVQETPKTTQQLHTYPNPFSQSTQITFTSQAVGYAEVSIVNMLGVEVARLFSGELGAGEHNFLWDADKDACITGTYECLVRMNGQVETLPLVLMR
jgi:photosystem II stability/assembly factor-like uncharacterized protein